MFIEEAKGAEIKMPVAVTLIQCGPPEDTAQTCITDERCCVFIEPSEGEENEQR